MSSTRNADAVSGQGEFHSKIERSEPMTTHGHKPGVLASEADKAPEFHAQTLPAGTAPPESTFKPNNISEVPLTESNASASETITGATSSDVHTGLGHPGQGQTSNELHHDGSRTGAKQTSGLEGVGASGVKSAGLVDERDPKFAHQRGNERDDAAPKDVLGGASAEDKIPESAETVAAEAPRK